MEWVQENFISILSSLFGGGSLIAFITERNKRKIEEKQASAEALETMQKAYDKFTEDSLKRYDSVILEVRELKEELTKEKVKFQLLQEENQTLRLENSKIRADYDILKSEFEKFKIK